MNPDEEAEQALREAYCDMISRRLRAFAEAMSWPDAGEKVDQRALVALFERYDSPPAYSTWRRQLFEGAEQAAKTELRTEGSNGQGGRAASPGAARLRAVQILHGERTSDAEWKRLVGWAGAHGGKRLYEGTGKDRKWLLTEDELAEALG
jgi:hypothetical protein